MKFSERAIKRAQRDIEEGGDDLVAAAVLRPPPLDQLPDAMRALDDLIERTRTRLDDDVAAIGALVDAVGAVWLVVSEADGDLAGFLTESDVMS